MIIFPRIGNLEKKLDYSQETNDGSRSQLYLICLNLHLGSELYLPLKKIRLEGQSLW